MKNVIIVIALFISSINSVKAQEKTVEKFSLIVQMSGFDSDKGKVFVAVYNKKKDFLENLYKGGTSIITDKKATFKFENLEKGEYAVSIFHDENGNNKMDTNFLGIPKEDYGCSNGAKAFLGPPKYDDAKFQLTKNKSIDIKI